LIKTNLGLKTVVFSAGLVAAWVDSEVSSTAVSVADLITIIFKQKNHQEKLFTRSQVNQPFLASLR